MRKILLEKVIDPGLSASQEIPRHLWNLMVHYHVYKDPPLIPSGAYFFKICFNIVIVDILTEWL